MPDGTKDPALALASARDMRVKVPVNTIVLPLIARFRQGAQAVEWSILRQDQQSIDIGQIAEKGGDVIGHRRANLDFDKRLMRCVSQHRDSTPPALSRQIRNEAPTNALLPVNLSYAKRIDKALKANFRRTAMADSNFLIDKSPKPSSAAMAADLSPSRKMSAGV